MQEKFVFMSDAKQKIRWYETWTFLIFICIIVPLTFRSLLFSPYHIPSASMKETLLIGDFIVVNKSAYGYSRYSFPFSPPLFEGRIRGVEPKRGDIVVFRPPSQLNTDFIKRLIGIPGDRVQVKKGRLYLNGAPISRTYVGEVHAVTDGVKEVFRQYLELLPRQDGTFITYEVLDLTQDGRLDNTPEYTVPEGHYFMAGSHKDSFDSRYKSIGYVKDSDIIGSIYTIL